MSAYKFAVAGFAVLTLAACASNSGMSSGQYSSPPPRDYGPMMGGGMDGPVGGGSISGNMGVASAPPSEEVMPERVSPAAAGSALSGFIGNRIGAAMDDEDKQRAYEAQIQALDRGSPGAPTSWRNPDSGRYGSIVPGPAYQQGGRNCRSFTHTIYIDSKPQTARGTACKNATGGWAAASG
jgi:surface antigen